MLNKNNIGSQSCSMLNETVNSLVKCSDQGSMIKFNNSPSQTIINNQVILQKEEDKSFFKRYISI